MAGAWVAFAYSGNPNHAGMANWKVFGKDRETMTFDRESVCRDDYDSALVEKVVNATHPTYISPAPKPGDKSAKREWMY